MARITTAGGGYGGSATVVHSDSSHTDYVSVPDGDLVFRGDYHRAGSDLVLTGHDGHHYVVPGYFAGDKHPALVAPNGASLAAETVDLLAGSPAPAHYAQAGQAAPPDSIGKVEKIVGDVTVLRNGVSVALHVGDAVYKSDVITTGANASAGITFPDGTVLDLVANSRMALNEYSFEPNGTDNGALFTLVEGTFGFVAGQVAHDNHMSVVTPVATMGIRGTAGIVRHEFRANAGDLIYSFLVLDEIDIRHHGHHVGSYEVRDNRPDSPTFGEILRFIEDSGYVTYIEPQGAGLPPQVTIEAITNARLFEDRPILQDLSDSYALFNPGGIHSPGSGDNPTQLFGPQFFQENNGLPFSFNFQGGVGSGGNTPVTISFAIPVQPNMPPANPPPPSSNIFIWEGGTGPFLEPNWNPNGEPTLSQDIVEIPSGTVTYPAGDNFTITELIVGKGATLDILGGTLTVLDQVINDGTIIGEGDPPTLTIGGPTTNGPAGSFVATGTGVEFEFTGDVFNSGLLKAALGGELLFDAAVVNEPGGTRKTAGLIISTGTGSTVDLDGDVFNYATIAALHGGTIAFDGGTVVNEAAGTGLVAGLMVARGSGSEITFSDTTIDNFGGLLATHHGEIMVDNSTFLNDTGGVVKAKRHGIITFDDTGITNDSGGIFTAIGYGSRIGTLDGSIDNFGTFFAADHGSMSLKSADITNEIGGKFKVEDGGRLSFYSDDVTNDGKILAFGHDSLVVLKDGELDNSGLASAKDGGAIKFIGEMVVNEAGSGSGAAGVASGDGTLSGGKIEATDRGFIEFAGGGVENQSGALIEARDHGVIVFKSTEDNLIDVTNDAGGKITAKDYGSIAFVGLRDSEDHEGGSVTNDGRMDAERHGTMTFDDIAVTNDGTMWARDYGTIIFEDVAGDTNGGLFNYGTIGARGWGSTVDFFHSDIYGGTLNADGGFIFVSSDSHLYGTIDIDISHSGIVDLAGGIDPCDATVNVYFCGAGTFALDPEFNPTPVATIFGFGVGDTIDLTNFQFSRHETVRYCDGILTITDCGQSESFALEGCYSPRDFVLLSDPWGGTEVVFGQRDYWISCEGGCWTACFNWSGGVPGVDNTAIIDKPVTVTIDDCQQVGNLVIGDHCAVLDIIGGGLTVENALDDNGRIVVTSDHEDPFLQIDGPVRVEIGGSMTAHGSEASIEFVHDQVGNAGVMAAECQATMTFDCAAVWNEGGTINAWSGALVMFSDSTVTNEFCSSIGANGCGSEVDFSWSTVCNDGRIGATYGGVVDLSHSTITQGCDGVIGAYGCNSEVDLDHATIAGGTLETGWGGLIQTVCGDSTFDDLTIGCGSDVLVNDGTALTLQDTIDNHGTITLAAAPDPALVIDGCVTLCGHGDIALSGDGAAIVGGPGGGTLDNVDNTIAGAGAIGDGQLTLINESCGVINANVADQMLTIDTEHPVTNFGTLEASQGGTLQVDDPVTGGGKVLVEGGVVHFEQAASIGDITFNNGGGTPTYGEVIFDHPNGLDAAVDGFTGTDSASPSLANTDEIDLAGTWTTESPLTGSGGDLVVDLTDGHGDTVALTFDDFSGTLKIGSDGSGGTLITDPPSSGGASGADNGATIQAGLNLGNDNFVFHPGMGADTIANFNPQGDTIELDKFPNIQNVQQLAALITSDAQGDALIELGHSDSIALPGVSASYLQAHLQTLVHLG